MVKKFFSHLQSFTRLDFVYQSETQLMGTDPTTITPTQDSCTVGRKTSSYLVPLQWMVRPTLVAKRANSITENLKERRVYKQTNSQMEFVGLTQKFFVQSRTPRRRVLKGSCERVRCLISVSVPEKVVDGVEVLDRRIREV